GNLEELIASSPVLKEHEFMLREIAARNKYVLSEKEEVAVAQLRNTGSTAWGDMKDALLATMRVPVVVGGAEKTLPLPAVRNLAYDADPATRKNAYLAEMKSYETVDKAVAAALNAIKGEVWTMVKMRGYESPLHMTLESSRMEKGTLEAMLSSMRDFLPSFRRYFRKKAKMLGHKGALPFYDVFAPVGKVTMTFTYERAMEFILDQFYSYSKRLGDFAKKAFDKNWIDAEVREGKRGGAFCSNLHCIGQSRVMANFDGSFSNVRTLAHELGHAYHGECLRHMPFLKTEYTMPIAETASNFCEAIVTDAAIKKAAGADEKRAILEAEISASMQVVVDIYSRYLFETAVFEKRQDGPLSVAEINGLMLQAQKDAYGDGLDPECLHPYMWANKPHYYYAGRNFYNFPYAYGMLFSRGLYAKYLQEGEAFHAKYDALLAATGSASLEAIGDLAGIDVRGKDFWTASLKLVDEKIGEFCA
ncbi:MAG: M3 family oligoendopeptidase, partial [Treponema sp.]|nr:M3 family oligoendopeptidase [Treponema sp.]